MNLFRNAAVGVMLCVGFYGYADNKANTSTTIDGVDTGKELVKMTFVDSAVILSFSDNTSVKADMTSVRVTFGIASSAIDEIIADPAKSKGIYNLKGQFLGESVESISPGIYIVNGQKILVK